MQVLIAADELAELLDDQPLPDPYPTGCGSSTRSPRRWMSPTRSFTSACRASSRAGGRSAPAGTASTLMMQRRRAATRSTSRWWCRWCSCRAGGMCPGCGRSAGRCPTHREPRPWHGDQRRAVRVGAHGQTHHRRWAVAGWIPGASTRSGSGRHGTDGGAGPRGGQPPARRRWVGGAHSPARWTASAVRKPTAVIRPVRAWARSNASGIMVSASMARIAPAATAVMTAMRAGETPSRAR